MRKLLPLAFQLPLATRSSGRGRGGNPQSDRTAARTRRFLHATYSHRHPAWGCKAALNAAQKEVEAGGWQDIALALAQQISGDTVAADTALKKLIDTQPNDAGYQIAQVYALRNDPDKVFEWLDRAWSNRDVGISQLLYDPFLIRYRQDPRFAAFCKKVGLPIEAL